MEHYKWTEKLTVNVREIDEQHRYLIDIINKLRHVIEDNSSDNLACEVLKELADYLKIHFASEEECMISHNYPDYSSHWEQHHQFIDTIGYFFRQLKDGKKNVAEDVNDFLAYWLFNHIRGVDTKLGLFLREKGCAEI